MALKRRLELGVLGEHQRQGALFVQFAPQDRHPQGAGTLARAPKIFDRLILNPGPGGPHHGDRQRPDGRGAQSERRATIRRRSVGMVRRERNHVV